MNKFRKFENICKDIKNLKIQGAEQVARAAAQALLLRHDNYAVKKLISLRPTEPCLRNTLKFVLSGVSLKESVDQALDHFDSSQRIIAEIGAEKIEPGMTIFTHCHSSSVVKILLKAKSQGTRFIVYNTETRPLFQGRKTSLELANAKINNIHIVDSAARIAIKKSDMVLLGCDAITTSKVYNKIGTEMFCEIAEKYGVPVYIASDSWKFDPESIYSKEEKIEERSPEEIWKAPKKPTLSIKNYAFEAVEPKLISAVISELGFFMKKSFIEEIRRNYPWMFANFLII
jgi:ribose 1,5-bisphosphate isomerase